MPLQLDVKRKFTINSDRVKCVDQHPTEPWILCALYSGEVYIWNYETRAQIKKIIVCGLPVRTAKFVYKKNWLITGSDDMQISVFNYNVSEKIHHFKAHSDYIRCIAIHSSQPFVLSCGDDKLIKLWNWNSNWTCQQVFKGHTHYVMHVVFNPNDSNTFASASLDGTVNVWYLQNTTPNFSLKGHEKGVNCVDYYHGTDKPYLVTGSDDCQVKIWDYQNKVCIQTLKSHTKNISAVVFHPKLPILFTGAEDGTVKIWHVGVFNIENTLDYGFQRAWSISSISGKDDVVLGFDQGCIMIGIGKDTPTITMDVKNRKVVQAKHFELQQVIIKSPDAIGNGEAVPISSVKNVGLCEIYPHTISFSPNHRFVVVCGNNEHIIYSAPAFKKKSIGLSPQVVWSMDGSEYATLQESKEIKIHKNFKETKSFAPKYGAECVYGGFLLGVKSSEGGTFSFYDWENLDLIRRIDILPRDVFWSENGEFVCLSSDQTYYILRHSADAVACAREFKTMSEDGIKDAFKVISEIKETVKSGLWVGLCFVYTNTENKINYYVGGEIINIANAECSLFLLGYNTKDHRLYLSDNNFNITSYFIVKQEFEYHTAVMKGDLETAEHLYYYVPFKDRLRLAQFLEKQGYVELAMHISTDPVHRFNIAISIGDLISAKYLAEEATLAEGSPSKISEERWARLGAIAAKAGEMELTKKCYKNARDYSALLVYAVSSGDKELLEEVAKDSAKEGIDNIAFMAYFTLNKLDECLQLLIGQSKLPESALFARTYVPSKIKEVMEIWKKNSNKGQTSSDLSNFENLFSDDPKALKLEKFQETFGYKHFSEFKNLLQSALLSNDERNLSDEKEDLKNQGLYEDTSSDDDE